jgi:hypothetical protein
MSDLYRLEGHEVVPCPDIDQWVKEFRKNRDVRKTQVGDVLVSTVFLGVDRGWGGPGAPVVFETMVFGGPLDREQSRYCSWCEAEEGHADTVLRVKEAAENGSR